MDDYLAMLGAAPTTAEKQQDVAKALRRRRSYGELATLTGDKVLQPFGQGLTRQADEYAKQFQETRQKDADNAQTKAYQDWQKEHSQATLEEQKRYHNMSIAAELAAIRQREDSAIMSMYGKGTKTRDMTETTRTKLLQHADTLLALKEQRDTFAPGYTQRLGAGPQSRLPNTLAQYGIGTAGSKESQQWWSNWQKFYTLPMRNLLFGATLTPNEQKAWEEVNINPTMSPKQIQDRIDRFMKQARSSATRRVSTMTLEGFDPEVLTEMYYDSIPDMALPDLSGIPRGGRTGGGLRRTIAKTSTETPADLTEQDMARLVRLRQMAE